MKKKFYLIFALTLTVHLLKAQSFPGGVDANLKLWLKSNQGTIVTAGFLSDWEYANDGSTFKFTSSGSEMPSLLQNKINFHPSVNFAGAQLMDGPTGDDAPIATELVNNDEYSVFVVWQTGVTSGDQSIWTQGKTDNASGEYFSFSTHNGSYGSALHIPPEPQTIPQPFSPGVWNISQIQMKNSGADDIELVNDQNISSTPLVYGSDIVENVDGAGFRAISTEVNRLGNSGAPNNAFDGDIAEIIIFDNIVSDADRNKIFSYLAIKYGVTLKTDLIASSGNTVWEADLDGGLYNNSVFGLALDNASGLEVVKSNSIETGNGDGTGQSGMANIVISDPSNLTTDQTYLLIGNDGGNPVEETTSIDLPPVGVGSSRLGREWKVQNLSGNDLGTVSLTFDLTDLNATGRAKEDYRLMVTDDPDGNFTSVNTVTYKASTYDFASGDTTVRFDNVTLVNERVFSLITFAAGALPVKWKSFAGAVVTGGILLNWVVDNNEEGKSYEIEHSSDGKNFAKTGEVLNKKDVQSYKFNYNTSETGIHYFRIRQVDLDGKAYYSKVVKVLIKGNSAYTIRLLNNPVINNYAEFEVIAAKRSKASIELIAFTGAKIANKQVSINQGTNRIKIPMNNAAAGTYLLKLQIDDVLVTEKVMKF